MLLTLGLLYRHVTLLPLILIVTFSVLIFTNAILKNMKMMKVYISGKIDVAVISEADRQKFARAEEMLKAKGYEVFNPTNEEWQQHLKEQYDIQYYDREMTIPANAASFYTYCLLRNLMAMATKDAVYFLDDWDKSDGSRTEHSFAVATCKRLFFQDRKDACEYLIERMYKEAKANGSPVEYDNVNDRNRIEIAYFTQHLDEAWIPL